ncbi:hypothetical protein CWI42_121770 [Ordospora colligata]|uniref:Uncharacterized protein n=1 Tax=Ordospora colligata OC4 TaxID=1354746 RepID=A0A0B2UI88_9MICR|nr:uncharacterized protein M896_121770 [Ordospora colligata OC4]KHN68954.1 hypothetical protein M896_121770 [Ordospora colligata OC4]TBU13988.1 hypothetical protein CWI40_121770 [Ordospora colligata]TBU14177.1 hypothetical protein CWI41_121770 [Ordospora colligata]TBU17846.1 hypothetical protein CWI42_121770 [Ordospora colligata]
MAGKISAGTTNKYLFVIQIILLGLIVSLLFHLDFIKTPTSDYGLIQRNNNEIQEYVYDQNTNKSKMNVDSSKTVDGMWKHYDVVKTKAILMTSDNEHVKIFDFSNFSMKQYEREAYLKYLNDMGGYVPFLRILRYGIRKFLIDALKDKIEKENNAPVIYGCLIIPNTEGGYKFMSRLDVMDVECTWRDIKCVYIKEESKK